MTCIRTYPRYSLVYAAAWHFSTQPHQKFLLNARCALFYFLTDVGNLKASFLLIAWTWEKSRKRKEHSLWPRERNGSQLRITVAQSNSRLYAVLHFCSKNGHSPARNFPICVLPVYCKSQHHCSGYRATVGQSFHNCDVQRLTVIDGRS